MISGFWAESLTQKEEIEGPNCCGLGPRAASLLAPGTGQHTCVWDLEGTGVEGGVSKAAEAIKTSASCLKIKFYWNTSIPICMLSVATLMWQQQGWEEVMEPVWPSGEKVFTIWSFMGNVCWPLPPASSVPSKRNTMRTTQSFKQLQRKIQNEKMSFLITLFGCLYQLSAG